MPVATTATYDRLFIGGEWVAPDSDRTIDVVNPATGQVIGSVPAASTGDVDRAVAAARRAFDSGWATAPVEDRREVLRRIADGYRRRAEEFASLITDEMGCPISVSRWMQAGTPVMQIEAYLELSREFAFEEVRRTATGTGLVVKEPVGVVAAVIPWNSPQASAMFKIPPALISGCTVVLKPAPETALDAMLFAEMLEEVGVPPGVVNVVPADRDVSEYLVSHPSVDKVAFTGSTAAGRRIASLCGNDLRRVTLELGGKSAAIVFADADLDAAVAGARMGSLLNTGQVCSNKTRFLVQDEVYDDVVERLVALMDAVVLGDPRDPATEMGPVVSVRQRDRVLDYLAIGQREGARLVRGGGIPAGFEVGAWVEPTLLAGVDNASRVAQEEVFGPVLTVTPFRDESEAVRLANDSVYGLSGAVMTADLDRAMRVARGVRTGGMSINGASAGLSAPFGGFKSSGIGREMGTEAFASYTEVKAIGVPPSFGTDIDVNSDTHTDTEAAR
ncbi:aldehyde dehydrogenase [Geodermatophilaceae bacterium NBWT11]|nr:aldehyde dehydrogenase [Geodermatophilaceae bacterium NBWT11]